MIFCASQTHDKKTMVKRIKNEQWSVKDLISKINQGEISKPQFQRKKKWDLLPKNESDIPNEQSYIQFLFDTVNSVHAITFGQETNLSLSNIDGNNRINAIKNFLDKPFHIFKDYLLDLNKYVSNLELNNEDKILLLKIFNDLSYNQIINFKYNHFFIENGYETFYIEKIKIFRDDFEIVIENIQKKLKINGIDNFDINVKINVNLFEGYNTNELCKIFEDINKYNSKLTETELLSCRLYNEFNFTLCDKKFEFDLKQEIAQYYNKKADGEVLNCYKFDPEKDKINAHDFIVGFQNFCSKKYKFFEETDADGLSLYFKLYKALYGGFVDTFTDENVNDFKTKIIYSCDILKELIATIFNDKINNKLFNKSCQDKIHTIKKNKWFLLIVCIIGYKQKEIKIIQKSLEKCLLYHFMVSELIDKEKKDYFQTFDTINPKMGGVHIDNLGQKLLSNADIISNKLTNELFEKLICQLNIENNNPHFRKLENGNNKNDKRRTLKFFERILMFYYYKQQIPTGILESEQFSIEHICPNSCDWDGELDKDRTGNQIPIIAKMNSSRQNRHINDYRKSDLGKSFCEFIKDIIPSDNIYERIVSHNDRKKPKIINIDEYNNMCHENEQKYLQNFISVLFSL